MDIDVIRKVLISALPILIAITFHEVSHGYVAYKLGDPTAKMLGRLTLNPIAHIDIFGTIILPFLLVIMHAPFVFGYAKPVPINPMNFKNPRQGMAISAAAGPITNLIIAAFCSILLNLVFSPLYNNAPDAIRQTLLTPLLLIFAYSAFINIILACFNMIPIPPLDGGRVLAGLLPSKHAISFSKIEPFGFVIVILLMYTHLTDYLILPLFYLFLKLFHLEIILKLPIF